MDQSDPDEVNSHTIQPKEIGVIYKGFRERQQD
jgi:hypothetical protein